MVREIASPCFAALSVLLTLPPAILLQRMNVSVQLRHSCRRSNTLEDLAHLNCSLTIFNRVFKGVSSQLETLGVKIKRKKNTQPPHREKVPNVSIFTKPFALTSSSYLAKNYTKTRKTPERARTITAVSGPSTATMPWWRASCTDIKRGEHLCHVACLIPWIYCRGFYQKHWIIYYHQRKKKKNSDNNIFDVCRARGEVCDIRLQGDLLHPSSTVPQSDCSLLMHLLVQRWFYAGWPQTVAHPSAHPDSALGSALFKMCLLCRIRDFPPPRTEKPATCV